MREYRSSSQILFGYLPQQTVDLRGGVWRVVRWRHPEEPPHVDKPSLRRQIAQQAGPWRATGKDGGFVTAIEQGHTLRVQTISRDNGVQVESFPNVWMCKRCQRILKHRDARCKCGSHGWPGQLHFVGYHDACGAIREPYIRRCKDHDDVKIVHPGTASASEIQFVCPVCERVLMNGFGHPQCQCGQGRIVFNVHRASSVYTPQSIVIVNPPSTDRINAISNAGGRARALSWLLDGMKARTVEETGLTTSSLRQQLLETGLGEEAVARMLAAATGAEGAPEEGGDINLSSDRREEAEREALTVALAMSPSRITIADLEAGTEEGTSLKELYRDRYSGALTAAGLESVDFVDDFPVLTGCFGYTRGDPAPGASRLVPFRTPNGDYVVYGDIARTEAVFIRLDPLVVAQWLAHNGFDCGDPEDSRDARLEILERAVIPLSIDPEQRGQFGDAVLRLIHSYAHRFIRLGALHAGIDRNALSELLVPHHLGFFIYAAAKGDFVLGGLQAVFESELHTLLDAIVNEEHRCALDPGCQRSGGACMACLHVGEPSCRYFNRFLDRAMLTGGRGGYFSVADGDAFA